jgi:hypothetical protein
MLVLGAWATSKPPKSPPKSTGSESSSPLADTRLSSGHRTAITALSDTGVANQGHELSDGHEMSE